MSTDLMNPGHGHSPAAWTAVVINLLAFIVGTIFFYLDLPWVVVACAIVAVLGFIVGWVMKKLGYGVGGSRYTPKEH